jgi:hypothetical protein
VEDNIIKHFGRDGMGCNDRCRIKLAVPVLDIYGAVSWGSIMLEEATQANFLH